MIESTSACQGFRFACSKRNSITSRIGSGGKFSFRSRSFLLSSISASIAFFGFMNESIYDLAWKRVAVGGAGGLSVCFGKSDLGLLFRGFVWGGGKLVGGSQF